MKAGRKQYAIVVLGVAALALLANVRWENWVVNWLYLHKGKVAHDHGDYGDAEVFFKRALLKDPTLRIARYDLGNALYQQGRYAEALRCYAQAQRLPTAALNASLWANTGNAYYQTGNLLKSQLAYQNALLINQNDRAIRQDFLFVQEKCAKWSENQQRKQKEKPTAGAEADRRKDETHSEAGAKQQASQTAPDVPQILSAKNTENIFDQINMSETMARGKISRTQQKGRKVASDAKDY